MGSLTGGGLYYVLVVEVGSPDYHMSNNFEMVECILTQNLLLMVRLVIY